MVAFLLETKGYGLVNGLGRRYRGGERNQQEYNDELSWSCLPDRISFSLVLLLLLFFFFFAVHNTNTIFVHKNNDSDDDDNGNGSAWDKVQHSIRVSAAENCEWAILFNI